MDKITYLSNEWDYLIIETDEEDSKMAAKITREDVELFGNFRMRLKPSTENNDD